MGQGCFGTVIRAVNKEENRLVAIKIEDCRCSRLKPVLRHEADIMRKLKSLRGVPELYHFKEWKGGLFMEMELLDRDLSQL